MQNNVVIQSDVEVLLTEARPKLIQAYLSGNAKMYHKVSEEFISVARRVFLYLYENSSDIAWSAFRAFGSMLCNSTFWMYTDIVHSFCDYLEKNKGVASASA